MKKIQITLFLICISLFLQGQVTIYPAPKKGFEQRIRTYIDTMKIVDTHEHLINPESIVHSGMLDFTLLFHHYADDDIKSGGMAKPAFERLLTDSLSVLQKWNEIKPYWENSFNTAYNRVVMLTVNKLFGIEKLDESTVGELSEKIKQAYKTDWHKTVFREKCGIEYLLADIGDRSFGDPAMMRFVQRFNYFHVDSKKTIEQLSGQSGIEIQSLDDLVASLAKDFEKAVKKGFVAVKTGDAYNRILFYEDVEKERAAVVFQLALKSKEPLPFKTIKPLSDYMMHRMIELARKYKKPVQIHTGLQAGDGNYIENSNPTHLANLFLKYRDVKFILFHGAYPFGGELASLAKNFQNVYIDLCWLYIISPSYSERYLHEWLETVPANKIMAFGGDYHNAENVYGHLLFAKEIIGNVLVEKVKSGYFSEVEALKIAQMILHDNAISLFHLKD